MVLFLLHLQAIDATHLKRSIRADGDALVDVLLVVRLVDPVLELEELGVGERRDLRQDRASTHAMVALLFHLDAVDAMLSRTSSRHEKGRRRTDVVREVRLEVAGREGQRRVPAREEAVARALGVELGTCVEIKILRRVRAESSRRPARHRRDARSMAWRCRFLAARPSQDSRVIAEK